MKQIIFNIEQSDTADALFEFFKTKGKEQILKHLTKEIGEKYILEPIGEKMVFKLDHETQEGALTNETFRRVIENLRQPPMRTVGHPEGEVLNTLGNPVGIWSYGEGASLVPSVDINEMILRTGMLALNNDQIEQHLREDIGRTESV